MNGGKARLSYKRLSRLAIEVSRPLASRETWFNRIQGIELIYHVTHPEGREERLVHAFQMRYFFRFELDH